MSQNLIQSGKKLLCKKLNIFSHAALITPSNNNQLVRLRSAREIVNKYIIFLDEGIMIRGAPIWCWKSKHLKGQLVPRVGNVTLFSSWRSMVFQGGFISPEMHPGPTILGPPPAGRHRT